MPYGLYLASFMSDKDTISRMLGPFHKCVLGIVSLERSLNFRKVVRETNDLIYMHILLK